MPNPFVQRPTHSKTKWSSLIPDSQWSVYDRVLLEAQQQGIRFALGGSFALATHTGCWRNTKDLDIYVLPEDRDRMIRVLDHLGLSDYYEKTPYDRWWIYRGYTQETIVDVIWAMANHRAQIDELWMSGPVLDIHGRPLRVLPAEAILWDKLYIMQRDRCDWPDVMNLIFSVGRELDWEYLIGRIGEDWPLLSGALLIFRWISPGTAQALPAWLWDRLQLRPESLLPPQPAINQRRVSLLDTRPWFGPDRQQQQPAAG
jgi:hypothetical protein